jgi:hypothetical protein
MFRLWRLWHCECTNGINGIEELSSSSLLPEDMMRSDLVFGAMTYVSNRFLLTRLAAKATRSFHRPNTRIADTANEVFERFTQSNPLTGVSVAGHLKAFTTVARGEIRTFDEDLEQSVA